MVYKIYQMINYNTHFHNLVYQSKDLLNRFVFEFFLQIFRIRLKVFWTSFFRTEIIKS